MYKLGYKDTDRELEIEIYGLTFKLPRINKKLQDDIKELEEKKEDINSLNESINLLLGENAVDKINKKRINDGYKELDILNIMQIISFIGQVIGKELVKIQIQNKEQFNNYKTNYRNNKPYNNNYRR